MKNVCTALGLSADASEEAALTEVTKLKNRVADHEKAVGPLNNRIVELETSNKTLLEAQVESDLEKYSNRFKPEAKETWKKNLIANRAGTIELLEGLTEVESGTTTAASGGGKVLNRKGAGTPGQADKVKNRAAEQRKAVDTVKLSNRCSSAEAWEIAAASNPELFENPKE